MFLRVTWLREDCALAEFVVVCLNLDAKILSAGCTRVTIVRLKAPSDESLEPVSRSVGQGRSLFRALFFVRAEMVVLRLVCALFLVYGKMASFRLIRVSLLVRVEMAKIVLLARWLRQRSFTANNARLLFAPDESYITRRAMWRSLDVA